MRTVDELIREAIMLRWNALADGEPEPAIQINVYDHGMKAVVGFREDKKLYIGASLHTVLVHITQCDTSLRGGTCTVHDVGTVPVIPTMEMW